MEQIDTYQKWLEQEGLPVLRGYSIPDLMAVELKPSKHHGGLGAYIFMVDWEGLRDGYLCEIPPGGSLEPEKHMYEEVIYILSGRGSTTVWNEGSGKQTFEWQEGSAFAPPLNAWHQHFNKGDEPVRYVSGTQAPLVMNLYNSLDYVFNNDYVFKNRFNGEPGYFSRPSKLMQTADLKSKRTIYETNFIPDCRTLKVADFAQQGQGMHKSHFEMSNGASNAVIDEYAVGSYKTADYEGGGNCSIILSGQGYCLWWPEDGGIMAKGVERMRIDWHKYTLLAIPYRWFHQNFNTGKEPARSLSLLMGWSFKYRGIHREHNRKVGNKSFSQGGFTIPYEEEDPAIRRLFKEELAKTGAPWRMSHVFSGE